MSRARDLLTSLRLRMALLLLVGMSGAAYLGGLVTWKAARAGGLATSPVCDPPSSSAMLWRHLPDYAVLLLVVSVALALVAVRHVTRPLARLADAAAAFATSLDPRSLPKTGAAEF